MNVEQDRHDEGGEPQIEESLYPSTTLAYEQVNWWYGELLKLIDARERFLQNILTFATTVTLGVPTLIKAVFNKSDFSSPFVYLAFAAFVIVLILWLVARGSRSGVTLVRPLELYEDWLGLSEWEFKKNYISFMGQFFETAADKRDWRRRLSLIMMGFFMLEVVYWLVWVILPIASTQTG